MYVVMYLQASGEVSHSTSQSSSALSLSGECSDSPPVPSVSVYVLFMLPVLSLCLHN